MKGSLYYCHQCKLRFQNQNFGYGYPKLNREGAALCPYCETPMAETQAESFPPEWVEERPAAPTEDWPIEDVSTGDVPSEDTSAV